MATYGELTVGKLEKYLDPFPDGEYSSIIGGKSIVDVLINHLHI